MWWDGGNRGPQTQYQDYPVSSLELAAWPAMSTSPAGFVDSPQLHSGGQGVCLWHGFLGCRNSENFLDRPSPIFASSFVSLLSPPAPAEIRRGSRRSQWAVAG